MPLEKSGSRTAIGHNISEMEASGHPHAQAVAAALDTARRAGASIPHRAPGGQVPWFVRREATGMLHTGPINSPVAGRTDHIPMNVPNGSYVLPADHVNHVGQGNTAAGHARLNHAFGPSGTLHPGAGAPRGGGGGGLPRTGGDLPSVFRAGGVTDGDDEGVPIMAAGGEYVIHPDIVAEIGNGNIKHGHQILDAWVKKVRQQHIHTLKKLPGPAQD